jgi:hypothetical protein
MESGEVFLTFGRYVNHRLKDVPTSYLAWLAYDADNVSDEIREAAEAEYWTREDRDER